jgi:hypothetical protein
MEWKMEEPVFTGGTPAPVADGHQVAPPSIHDDGNLDLSGVDPLRRDEVRRRIAVVKSFLALAASDDDDLRRHARKLELSTSQFKALVRAWRDYPSGSSMAQSGRSRGRPRATGPRHLDEETKAISEATIAGLSPGATLTQAMAAVASACAAHGLEVPGKTTVWKMLTAARRLQIDPSGRGAIVVGRCWLRVPVVEGDTLFTPSVALAVRADDAVIIGATTREDGTTGAALIALGIGQPDLRSLDFDEQLSGAQPERAGAIGTPSSPSAIRRRLSRILGDRIGNVRPIFKTGAEARPERLLRSRKDRPLDPADAGAVIRAAIDAHNAERGAGRAVWID